MVTRKLKVTNELGLHARAAAAVVFSVDGFSSEIVVRRGEQVADARSILELLLLGASRGSVIEVTAVGIDEEQAIEAITALVLAGLDDGGAARGN